jgi:ATP adenylyltransferase
MVSPYRHLACITKLNNEESLEMTKLTKNCIQILRDANNPDGFNVGFNLGKSAGAGYDEHIHNHIVPRWTGDTNFMPALAETKVVPEHLKKTYERLASNFKKLHL